MSTSSTSCSNEILPKKESPSFAAYIFTDIATMCIYRLSVLRYQAERRWRDVAYLPKVSYPCETLGRVQVNFQMKHGPRRAPM